MSDETIQNEESKDHSPECKAKVALEAIREEMTAGRAVQEVWRSPGVIARFYRYQTIFSQKPDATNFFILE